MTGQFVPAPTDMDAVGDIQRLEYVDGGWNQARGHLVNNESGQRGELDLAEPAQDFAGRANGGETLVATQQEFRIRRHFQQRALARERTIADDDDIEDIAQDLQQ